MMDSLDTIDYVRHHDLTIGEVKACPQFAHLSEAEVTEVIETLKLFTKIAFDFHENNRQNSRENG
jgi:hypothetical protein